MAKYNRYIQPDHWEERIGESELVKVHKAELERAQIIHTGFFVQEVEAAEKEIGYDFHGIALPQNERDHYGIRYSGFTAPLVKALQELQQQNQTLPVQLDNQNVLIQ
jgi:trimeric autotransporter adhesin